MSSWPIVILDDLKSDEPRAITDGPFGSNLARRHYTEAGPRVVRLQNIGDGFFVDEHAHISEDHFDALQKHEVAAGDLLVASLGEVLPRACLAPNWLGAAIVKADCIRVRLSDQVDSRWVLYALQRASVRSWAEQHRHGIGRPRLGLEMIRQIPIPLPQLDEQRRIVDILEDHLSHLDAAGAWLTSAAGRVQALQRSSLDLHFGTDGGDVLVPLDELVQDITAGKSFGGSNAPAGPDEWGIIKVSAMTWGRFDPDENKAVPANHVDPRFEIRQGDLLVSRANTSEYVGASVLVESVRPRLILSDKSLRVIPRAGTRADWLWRALQAPTARRQISALATGTKDSMRNISQASLRQVLLPKIDPVGQAEAVARFDEVRASVDHLTDQLQRQERRLSLLRQALLEAAFSGCLTDIESNRLDAEEMITA